MASYSLPLAAWIVENMSVKEGCGVVSCCVWLVRGGRNRVRAR